MTNTIYKIKFPNKVYLKEAVTLLSAMNPHRTIYRKSISQNINLQPKKKPIDASRGNIIINGKNVQKSKHIFDRIFHLKHVIYDMQSILPEDILLENIRCSYKDMNLDTYYNNTYMVFKQHTIPQLIERPKFHEVNVNHYNKIIDITVFYQKWKRIGLVSIENQHRCRISFFPLEQLKNRGKSIEHTFSPDEENVLLLAYDKNLVRIIYFLCQNIYIYFNIVKYYLIFSEKIDNYTRNIFINKLKLWLNLDIFRASYKYNDIEKYIGKPEEYREKTTGEYDSSIVYPTSKGICIDSFDESLRCLKKTFLNHWKVADDREKIKMSTITSCYPLSYVFKRIVESYRFLCLLQLNKKQILAPFFFRSSNLRYYISEILCDIIAQFKMLHVTESWILSTIAIYQETIIRLSAIFQYLEYQTHKRGMNHVMRLLKVGHDTLKQQYYKIQTNTEEISNFTNLVENDNQTLISNIQEKYSGIEYLLSKLQELTQESTIESALFDVTKTNTKLLELSSIIKTNVDEKKIKHMQFEANGDIDDTEALKSTRLQLETHVFYIQHRNTNDFTYYQNLCIKKKYDVRTLEYLYSLSKSLKYTLAQDHIRLVMSVAKNNKYKYMEMSDLLQEGMLGLTKAVERFQLDRGYQFTTYATWWVHQALNRVTLSTNQMIPLPTHVQKKVHLILNTSVQLAKRFGREPYLIEIANELRIHVRKIYQYLEASALSRRIISLDQKFRAGDNRTYMHLIQSHQQRTPNNFNILFSSIFRSMSKKESTILKMRLGIYPFKRHTVDQLTKIFSVNKEKIKFVEKICFEKAKKHLLQDPDSINIISSFIENVS